MQREQASNVSKTSIVVLFAEMETSQSTNIFDLTPNEPIDVDSFVHSFVRILSSIFLLSFCSLRVLSIWLV